MQSTDDSAHSPRRANRIQVRPAKVDPRINLVLDAYVFSPVFVPLFLRSTPLDDNARTLCLTSVTNRITKLRIDQSALPFSEGKPIIDLLTNTEYSWVGGQLELEIDPYQVLWLNVG